MHRFFETAVRWGVLVGLIGLIAAIYGAVHRGDTDLAAAISVIGGPGIFGALWWVTRRARQAASESAEGARLLAKGRHLQALRKFEEAERLADNAAYRYNIAVAKLLLLRLSEATEELDAIVRSRNTTPQVRDLAHAQLAFAKALSGRAPEEGSVPKQEEDAPLAILTRAVWQVRRGEWAEAESTLSQRELKQLGGFHRAMAETLLAFCALTLRDEEMPVDLSSLFGEAAPDQLLQAWPALGEFIDGRSA